ncbi:transcriptional regulator [Campylobacter mucosalis]|uniref:transcriptional regulator n=1 Tax=Campylobacter mucosalis TaxID=202 RepID=UPI00146FE718|nr:transcriptional regulator [Campylobacter mucosalis]
MTNLTQRDMAGILKIDTKTIYNWRKNKPELYRIVMPGFKFDELLKQSRENLTELENIAKENENFRLK